MLKCNKPTPIHQYTRQRVPRHKHTNKQTNYDKTYKCVDKLQYGIIRPPPKRSRGKGKCICVCLVPRWTWPTFLQWNRIELHTLSWFFRYAYASVCFAFRLCLCGNAHVQAWHAFYINMFVCLMLSDSLALIGYALNTFRFQFWLLFILILHFCSYSKWFFLLFFIKSLKRKISVRKW